jgi:3-dehydroquinate synthase
MSTFITQMPADFASRLACFDRVFIVRDERLAFERCVPWLPASSRIVGEHTLASGEAAKDLESIAHAWKVLMEAGADRNTLLCAFGGGSTTDAAGFIGSTFKRGMPVALVPTTVVGMVDASIGGKTGINFNDLKNQIGTFSPPVAIGISPHWLDTLPVRERLSGWMEMLKHAYIDGPEAVERAHRVDALDDIGGMIADSAQVKVRVVEADPEERGMRKALNFGHTVGHALEAAAWGAGRPIAHGLAVGFGMAFSLRASVELGAGLRMEQADEALERLRFWLANTPVPEAAPETLWAAMQQDKKNRDGVVMEVWLADWGQPQWDQPLKRDDFKRIWSKTRAEFAH